MKVIVYKGDLVRNTCHPNAGIGIVIEIGARCDYVIAVFPAHGHDVVYADEIEVVNESR